MMCRMLVEMKEAFATEESELHAKMHPSVAGVHRGKPLCVLRELLKRGGHGEIMLVEDLSNGFALVGHLGGHSTWVNKVSAEKAAGQERLCGRLPSR
eukprot:2029353-Amphidinium_carterae.1